MKKSQVLILVAVLLAMPIAVQMKYDLSIHNASSVGYAVAWLFSGAISLSLGASLMEADRKEVGSWVFIMFAVAVLISIVM